MNNNMRLSLLVLAASFIAGTSFLHASRAPAFVARQWATPLEKQMLNEAWTGTLNEKNLQESINQGANIEARDDSQYTALMIAAQYGYIESLKALINAGADLDAQTLRGYTALTLVTRHRPEHTLTIVKMLLDAGADVNRRDERGTPFDYALNNPNNIPLIKLLLKSGANPFANNSGGGPSYYSYMVQDRPAIKKIIDDFLTSQTPQQIKALKNAAHLDQQMINEAHRGTLTDEQLQRYIKDGVDINAKAEMGYTALMLASMDGQVGSVEALCKAGADPNVVSEYYGYDALSLVADHGKNSIPITQLLLNHGANPNEPRLYNTPLDWAVYNRNIPLMRLLLKSGANPYIKTTASDALSPIEQIEKHPESYADQKKVLDEFLALQTPEHIQALRNVAEKALATIIPQTKQIGGLTGQIATKVQDYLRPVLKAPKEEKEKEEKAKMEIAPTSPVMMEDEAAHREARAKLLAKREQALAVLGLTPIDDNPELIDQTFKYLAEQYQKAAQYKKHQELMRAWMYLTGKTD